MKHILFAALVLLALVSTSQGQQTAPQISALQDMILAERFLFSLDQDSTTAQTRAQFLIDRASGKLELPKSTKNWGLSRSALQDSLIALQAAHARAHAAADFHKKWAEAVELAKTLATNGSSLPKDAILTPCADVTQVTAALATCDTALKTATRGFSTLTLAYTAVSDSNRAARRAVGVYVRAYRASQRNADSLQKKLYRAQYVIDSMRTKKPAKLNFTPILLGGDAGAGVGVEVANDNYVGEVFAINTGRNFVFPVSVSFKAFDENVEFGGMVETSRIVERRDFNAYHDIALPNNQSIRETWHMPGVLESIDWKLAVGPRVGITLPLNGPDLFASPLWDGSKWRWNVGMAKDVGPVKTVFRSYKTTDGRMNMFGLGYSF